MLSQADKKPGVSIPTLYAIFVLVTLIVIPLGHLIWFQEASTVNLPDVQGVSLEFNSVFLHIIIPLAIVTAVIQFIITIASFRYTTKRYTNDVVFPAISFVNITTFGFISIHQVPLAFNWVNMIGFACFGGLTAWSLSLILYFRNSKNSLESKLKTVKDYNIFAKRLELEHNTFLSIFQWMIWVVIIFMVSGVAAIAFKPEDSIPLSLHSVILQNLVFISIVGVTGFMFGILIPILGYLRLLREIIEKISEESNKK